MAIRVSLVEAYSIVVLQSARVSHDRKSIALRTFSSPGPREVLSAALVYRPHSRVGQLTTTGVLADVEGTRCPEAPPLATRTLIVLGAGAHATVVASTAQALGHEVLAFYDDDESLWGQHVLGAPVAGPTAASICSPADGAVIAIGDNAARKRVAERLDLDWITLVHPFTWVAPDVRIDRGSVVLAGSVVQAGALIGRHVIVNTRSGVDHDTESGDFSHVASAQMAGGASAGEGVLLGLNSAVMPGVHVGPWAVVGAGALVRNDVPPHTTVVGVPAREIAVRSLSR